MVVPSILDIFQVWDSLWESLANEIGSSACLEVQIDRFEHLSLRGLLCKTKDISLRMGGSSLRMGIHNAPLAA